MTSLLGRSKVDQILMKNCIRFIVRTVLNILCATTLITFTLPAQTRMNTALKDVIIVFKTHFDNGYTDLSERVLQRYSTTLIDGALKGIDSTEGLGMEQQFTWTLSGYPVHEILRRNPALRSRVGDAIRNGKIAVHALPFTFETESMTPELLVRGFRFSNEIARSYSLDLPIDAKLTDVPSHSWILPTALAQAGIKFLHLGCNAASRSPEVPLLFWWEGPDGSRLMTLYWGGYYGTDLIPPDGWPFTSWLAIIHTNDNQGAPSLDEIKETLNKAHQLAPNARIRVGRMSDFYHALIKENPDLPVVRGDMPDTWIHGYMSMPKVFGQYSKDLRDLKVVESVSLLNHLLSRRPPVADPAVAPAYEDLLLFAEHTFGMAMSHGHSGIWRYDDDFRMHRALGEYDLIEHSWQEKSDRVFQATRVTLPALEKQLDLLAANVKAEGRRIVVYNPLPYPRSGMVELHAHSGTGVQALKDAVTGEPVLLENKDNVYRFEARNVPGMGYRTFVPADAPPPIQPTTLAIDPANGTLKNEHLVVKLDQSSGRLISVIDRSTGREMIARPSKNQVGPSLNIPEGAWPFGGYVYQRFDKKQVDAYAKAYIKGGWEWAPAELGRPNLDDRDGYAACGSAPVVRWEISDTRAMAFVLFKASERVPQTYTLIYALEAGRPALEITWSIQSKQADPWPEAGWIAFPFNIEDPEFRVGRLGGIADPTKDFVKGSNFDYYMTQHGVALYNSTSGAGFAVTSPDAPAVSLDRPGLWTWTGDFIPRRANVFFNLFNNQWSTNFTEWIEGSWSAHFYVWPFKSYDPAAGLVVPAEEVTTPMYAAMAAGPAGTFPLSCAGVEVSHKHVAVTAFGPTDDGEGVLLRLWEMAGRTVSCEIRLPEGSTFRTATPVDLRNQRTGRDIAIERGRFSIPCPASRPVTVVLR
jgi:alpha-mannosidase